MFNTQQLDAMSRIALPEADRTALVDIASVHIDTTLPAAERMENYLQQVKNPYLFRSGNTIGPGTFRPGRQRFTRTIDTPFYRFEEMIKARKAVAFPGFLWYNVYVIIEDWR